MFFRFCWACKWCHYQRFHWYSYILSPFLGHVVLFVSVCQFIFVHFLWSFDYCHYMYNSWTPGVCPPVVHITSIFIIHLTSKSSIVGMINYAGGREVWPHNQSVDEPAVYCTAVQRPNKRLHLNAKTAIHTRTTFINELLTCALILPFA